MAKLRGKHYSSKEIASMIIRYRKDAKKEVFVGIITMLKNWNCQNNPKIKTTINTIIIRIEELQNV